MFSPTKKLVGSISSISTCPCNARFIPTITDSYIDDTLSKPIKSMSYSRSFYTQSPENIKIYGVAYAIKTSSRLVEVESSRDGHLESTQTPQPESVEVSHFIQTKLGM